MCDAGRNTRCEVDVRALAFVGLLRIDILRFSKKTILHLREYVFIEL